MPIILKISLLNKIACYKVSIKKGMKIWTIQIKDAMKYIEVFVRSYYERTDKGWQVGGCHFNCVKGYNNKLIIAQFN